MTGINGDRGRSTTYFPFPVLDEKIPRYALGPIDGLVLSKQAVQKAGAQEVLAYLASLESLKAMSRGSGRFCSEAGRAGILFADAAADVKRYGCHTSLGVQL